MDINENNFKILTGCLANTLSPDPSVRRPGELFELQKFHDFEKFCFCDFSGKFSGNCRT
jgi:hypothetical protein